MVQKCFLCTGEIRTRLGTTNSKENSTLLLCQILGLPHLETNLENSEGIAIDYCYRCSYRIVSLRDMLEQLEKLEKRILHEKYLIEVQLKENARQRDCETGGQISDPMNEWSRKIGHVLTAGTIQSMLNKISTRQVEQTDTLCPQPQFRIIECARILETPTTDNQSIVDNSVFAVQAQCPTSESGINEPVSPMVISPNHDEEMKSYHILSNLDNQGSLRDEVLDSSLNANLSPISSTELEFDDDEVDTTYETRLVNSDLSEVHNHNPFDDELIPLSEYAARNRMHDQIHAGTSTGTMTLPPPKVKVEVKVEQTTEGKMNTFICQTCGISFHRYNQMLIHNRLHTRTDKSNKFNISQSRLQNSRARTLRQNLSPLVRRIKCEECGRMLALFRWKEHNMQVHRRQRKYKCDIGHFGCRKKSHFADHMLTHSDVRNFKCHLCPASFKQKKGLERHIKTHTQ